MEKQPESDFDVRVMHDMTAEDLERYTEFLEEIEKENRWFSERSEKSKADDPNRRLTAEEIREHSEHMCRFDVAHKGKLALVNKYTAITQAYILLMDYTLEAIETLFLAGKLDHVDSLQGFWIHVYHQILQSHGAAIRQSADWKHVKILESIKEEFTPLLSGFAEVHFRQKKKMPMLAQILERL
jgi:hypothetical protein